MLNKKKLLVAASLLVSAALPVSAYSESKLDNMVSPVTNPVNFEDARNQTSIRPIFMYHSLPKDFVTNGGDIQLWALQARLALTDKLSFIATKDGYIQINSDTIPDSEGSANLAAGLKYAVIQDDEKGEIASLSLRYEWATGDPDVFQGNDDGVIQPGISYARNLGPVNMAAYTGLRLGVDKHTSDLWDLSLHFDHQIESFYPSIDFNLVHVINAGDKIGLPDEGFDLVNFGASGAESNTVLTMGVGGRYRVCNMIDVGAAYEFPLTSEEDVFDWRVTADMIVKWDVELL